MSVVRQKSWARLRERNLKFCFWPSHSLCDFGKVMLVFYVSFLTCKMKQFDRLISFQSNHFGLFKRNPILKSQVCASSLWPFGLSKRVYPSTYS